MALPELFPPDAVTWDTWTWDACQSRKDQETLATNDGKVGPRLLEVAVATTLNPNRFGRVREQATCAHHFVAAGQTLEVP